MLNRDAIEMDQPHVTTSQRPPSESGVLALMGLCSYLLTIDFSITSIALPTIGRELSVPPHLLSLLVVADTLPIASLLIVGGRLADRFGHRKMLFLGLTAYSCGSVIAAWAPNFLVLALARGLHGVATAVISPASFSLIAAFLPEGPPRQRGLGLFAITQGAAAMTGVLIGGALVSWIGWHVAYMAVVPLLFMALLLTSAVLPGKVSQGSGESLDLVGATIITAATILMVGSFMILGRGKDSALIMTAVGIIASVGLIMLFVRVENRAAWPLVPPALLQNSRFLTCCLVIFLTVGTGVGFNVITQINMQNVLKLSAAQAGVASLPSTGAGILAGILAPWILRRLAPRMLLILAFVCGACGLALMAITVGQPYALSVLPGSIIIAMAHFLAFVSVVDIATAQLAQTQQGIGTGVLFTSYQVGIAVVTTLTMTLAGAPFFVSLSQGLSFAYTALIFGFLLALLLSITRLRAANAAG